MVAEENKSTWADSDSEESSSGTSSSSESEDEVQCLLADDTEEVFDFSNPEFTREDLVTALNEMVLEYRKLSHSFKDVKAEKESCATSTELVGSSNMQAALNKLETVNSKLRSSTVHREFLRRIPIVSGHLLDARASGDAALSSPCWDLLATMRRVVNYHSSWARQRKVELFDASGNPGFTAGRGFNPAGGTPRGG
ncbi:hypothetical protein F511_10524 [Dorcoceras hygrometricum]|uniref:Uncharacterized protein n=1 Tax=Dorcoceras hygrometricum TaxID=472368 RepID=A0A2Z7AKB4_9LAMI|nr:hypothetical protein F511_10524 [Dorcoceras hygrometricum]